MKYIYKNFKYTTPPGLDAKEPRHPVVIIGAGPIGLAMAIDLALKGIPSVVLDDNNVVSVGSRAICWAKRTLEIFDRLGIGERMLAKGVTWKIGRLFHGDHEVYSFDLLPEAGHKFPAFINLQQYYVEQYLVERAQDFPDLIDLRFKNKVTSHQDFGDYVRIDIETPDGEYQLEASYYLACDGAGSATRQRMGLSFEGQSFEDHFLIVDVEMDQSPFETDTPERWFWFEPPFHNGQSALLHKQPDNIYRIDLQLGSDADPNEESKPENVLPRIKAIMGDKPFELDWMSVYKFRCARLDQFVHNRVIFVGDSAHVVSPFGARGGNGGIQDVDNLGWKLAAIIKGEAPNELLNSYSSERGYAADENILNSTRSTDFLTPKSEMSKIFRNSVLSLADDFEFARPLINSGRLSRPSVYKDLSIEGSEDMNLPAQCCVGTPCSDAPVKSGYLLNHLTGRWILLSINCDIPKASNGFDLDLDYLTISTDQDDPTGLFRKRYLGDHTSAIYLIRPDQHIAARWLAPGMDDIQNIKKNLRLWIYNNAA